MIYKYSMCLLLLFGMVGCSNVEDSNTTKRENKTTENSENKNPSTNDNTNLQPSEDAKELLYNDDVNKRGILITRTGSSDYKKLHFTIKTSEFEAYYVTKMEGLLVTKVFSSDIEIGSKEIDLRESYTNGIISDYISYEIPLHQSNEKYTIVFQVGETEAIFEIEDKE